jgi:hypothetical protein
LPQTISTDENAVRHEKLGWEEISLQAAKIVSFTGVFLVIVLHSNVNLLQTLLAMSGISKLHFMV